MGDKTNIRVHIPRYAMLLHDESRCAREFTTNSVHPTYVPAYVCTHVYLRNRPYMPGAGGAMTQTFYRLFGYVLLDNRVDQNAVARVNYRIDSKSCYRG